MKKFDYSKNLTYKESIELLRFMAVCSVVIFLIDSTLGLVVLLLSFYIYLYGMYFKRQILSITIHSNLVTIYRRRNLFFPREAKILPEDGVIQYWDKKNYRHLSKDYIYTIKNKSSEVLKITPLDNWEKSTIEELIKEVQKIGIPLKGNLKNSIEVQINQDNTSKDNCD